MKRIILLLSLVLISAISFSQDIIYLTNGLHIKCKVTGIDEDNVYFNYKPEGVEINSSVNRNSIKEIRYKQFDSSNMDNEYSGALTMGLLQGGGSLVGMDLEYKFSDFIGIQGGVGLIGYGLGLDVHFRPTIRSSFFSFQYWHQGVNNGFTQSVTGPNVVFRGKRWFTAQIGLGFVIKEGPAWPENMEHTPVMLTYAIGAYIPW
jgi:hypothetical protein